MVLRSLLILLSLAAYARPAELIVVNANIRTLDSVKPRASALAVSGGRIAAVGSDAEIRKLATKETVVIDAEGKLLIPGFNDAHVHFAAMGKQFFAVDGRDASSLQALLQKITYHVRFLPKGKWVLGGGWNAATFLPERTALDAVTPDHPVFLYDSTAKMVLVNSLALKLSGIGPNTKNPPDGVIERDADGAPTGILRGSAIALVRRFTPTFSPADQIAVAETASNYAAAYGVTSVQDVSADDLTDVYRELRNRGTLKTRIYDCVSLSEHKTLIKLNIASPTGDEFIRRGCVKGMADGDAELSDALFEEIAAADRAGIQVAMHAIGPTANAQILSVFERVAKKNGLRDRRFRVEHAHGFRAADVRRFAPFGIIASVQPFLFSDQTGASRGLLRDLLNAKATLAFGSDASMITVDPLKGIAAAVNAADPRQRLTVDEAVRLYTIAPAFAEFQEKEKGTLTVGKLADFVVLSNDIFAVPGGKIASSTVTATFVGGLQVYKARGA
jgi:predicted amidohydrolase YtcJ